MTRRRKTFDDPTVGYSDLKRSPKGDFYTPDDVYIQKELPALLDLSGYLGPQVTASTQYEDEGHVLPAYSYLATGRFFSTKITPKEYGDGDVDDLLIILIHKRHITKEMSELLKPTAVVRLSRREYGEERRLYRLDTGNPYPSHWEYKAVPIVG